VALSPARFSHDGQDQGVASQGNFSPTVIGVNIFGHCFHLQSEYFGYLKPVYPSPGGNRRGNYVGLEVVLPSIGRSH
jgi:hypothetical protein